MRRTSIALLLSLLFTSLLLVSVDIREAEASGTVYIRADGSIDPSAANITTTDNVTYTFTGNNYASIVVERDHIVVDGAGHTLQGDGAFESRGFDLTSRTNMMVQNTRIENFHWGIWLNGSSVIRISGNTLTKSGTGVKLGSSSGNIISGNNISANAVWGILLDNSPSNLISGNTITDNDNGVEMRASSNNIVAANTMKNRVLGIGLYASPNTTIYENSLAGDGFLFLGSYQNAVANNTVNGKPIVYLEGMSNYTVTGNPGQVILVSCEYMRVENLTLSNTCVGITLDQTSHSNISRNTVSAHTLLGMSFYFSSNVRVFHNDFINNKKHVSIFNLVITWDDGYPSGGNYWSGYADFDVYKGPNQNETGNDGIWDHPYMHSLTNYDAFPLAKPYGEPVGDVDGDHDVDIYDIVRMGIAYGAEYPNPRYDRLCDMDLDGDIDIFDLVAAAGNYGDSW